MKDWRVDGRAVFRRMVAALWAGMFGMNAFGAEADERISVLILSGQNNHAWRETTPMLRAMLESTGRFSVEVTEYPERLDNASLEDYDALLSNWNAWSPDAAAQGWPEATRQAYVDFTRRGGGVVTLHAGGSSFYDWEDYHRIGLARWERGVTAHGPPHRFPVHITGPEHPILRGIDSFEIFDELWRKPEVHAEAQPIAYSLSGREDGGSESMEPCVFVGRNRLGRSVATTLGHGPPALSHPTLKLILARALEWAAGKDVTLEQKDFLPSGEYHWWEKPDTLALIRDGKTVWRFNAGEGHAKPCFHPLAAPDGEVLTGFRPMDHRWHRGAWWSWKFLDGKNFWEEDADGVPRDGLTQVEGVRVSPRRDHSAKIEMSLSYPLKDGVTLLAEERLIEVSAPAADGSYMITSTHDFEALRDVTVNHWYYGGFSLRLAKDHFPGWQFVDSNGPFPEDFGSNWQVNDGERRITTEPARWTAFVEGADDVKQGIAILDNPGNRGHPPRWLVIRGMPFFGPVMHYENEMALRQGERLKLRYRIVVFAQEDPQRYLQEEYKKFNQR